MTQGMGSQGMGSQGMGSQGMGSQSMGYNSGQRYNMGNIMRGDNSYGVIPSSQKGVRQTGEQGRLGHFGWLNRLTRWPYELFAMGRPGPVNASRSRPEMEQRGLFGLPVPWGD